MVPVSQLKAVFFVRDFNGNSNFQERKSFVVRGQGRRVEVNFTVAETILGTTLNYWPDCQGFLSALQIPPATTPGSTSSQKPSAYAFCRASAHQEAQTRGY